MATVLKAACWFLLFWGSLTNLNMKMLQHFFAEQAKRGIHYAQIIMVIQALIFIVFLCIVLTLVLFRVFTAVFNLPNVATVFIGVFGFIAGLIALYEYFRKY